MRGRQRDSGSYCSRSPFLLRHEWGVTRKEAIRKDVKGEGLNEDVHVRGLSGDPTQTHLLERVAASVHKAVRLRVEEADHIYAGFAGLHRRLGVMFFGVLDDLE